MSDNVISLADFKTKKLDREAATKKAQVIELPIKKEEPKMNQPEATRARENADIVVRMKRGETLSLVAPQDTWWPPRPMVKKDAAEIARTFAKDEK